MPEASSSIDLSADPAEAAEVRDAIWGLSSDQAAAVLAERSADFRPAPPTSVVTSRDAELRLAQLSADVDWYHKLMAGDIQTRDEFNYLTALKAGVIVSEAALPDEPVVETTIGDTGLPRRALISAAEDMRRDGFSDAAIEHILSDGKFDAESVYAAQYWIPRMERDPNLLCDQLPPDREFQLKVFRTIAAIGTGDTP
jgi:hypothetical protein